MIWLDTALHAEPEVLKKQLSLAGKIAASKTKTAPVPVRFLLGNACHPEMDALARNCAACPAPFKNCIEAFVGERQTGLESGKTMLITPGWVRAWPGRASALGWDETEMRIQHGRYDRILLLEPGVNPVSDEEIFKLFDLLRVPIDIEPLDLAHFRKTVADILGD